MRGFAAVHPGRSILFGSAKTPRCAPKTSQCIPTGARFRCLGVDFESPFAGSHGVSNVLAGIAAARALDIAPERLRDAVRRLTAGRMRGERSERRGVDCHQRLL